MPYFAAVKAEKLFAGTAIFLVLVSVTSYLLLTRAQTSTPIPRALLWSTVPVTTDPPGEEPGPVAEIGSPAPDFTLTTPDEKPVTLSSFRGQPVLLYFWASWCTFCRDDMPDLENLAQVYKDAGLQVLAINILEKPSQVESFGRVLGLSIPLLLDSKAAVSQTYLIRATPTYIFIDRDGVLAARLVGRNQQSIVLANLETILEPLEEEEPNN